MKRLGIFLLGITTCLCVGAVQLPASTNKLVNDFAGVLRASEVSQLETMLEAFSDSTSNQICIVTVADLQGLESSDYAQRLGEAWGVGSKNKQVQDNGVVILIKPRNAQGGGDVAIATGYGIEGGLPDAVCKRIIDRDMIPLLKEADYYGALQAAVARIMPIMAEEYAVGKEDMHEESEDDPFDMLMGFLAVLAVAILVIFWISKAAQKSRYVHNIAHATSVSELEKAVRAAERAKISPAKIEQAKLQIPANSLQRMSEAATPEEFTHMATDAIAMGVGVMAISKQESEMRGLTLEKLRQCTDRDDLPRREATARAFGNSDADVEAARKVALVAIAAMAAAALAAARRRARENRFNNYGNGGFSGGSSFGGFGGGSFGGGGASGKF